MPGRIQRESTCLARKPSTKQSAYKPKFARCLASLTHAYDANNFFMQATHYVYTHRKPEVMRVRFMNLRPRVCSCWTRVLACLTRTAKSSKNRARSLSPLTISLTLRKILIAVYFAIKDLTKISSQAITWKQIALLVGSALVCLGCSFDAEFSSSLLAWSLCLLDDFLMPRRIVFKASAALSWVRNVKFFIRLCFVAREGNIFLRRPRDCRAVILRSWDDRV